MLTAKIVITSNLRMAETDLGSTLNLSVDKSSNATTATSSSTDNDVNMLSGRSEPGTSLSLPPENVNPLDEDDAKRETLSGGSEPETSHSSLSENVKPLDEDDVRKTTTKTEGVKEEISEFLTFKDPRKRMRSEEEEKPEEEGEEGERENTGVLLDVFLRAMYPLNDSMDKTITVGVFKSLNFKPAVLLNQCGKSCFLFTAEMWDKLTKFLSIIEAYLYNKITGRKTAIGFDNADLEIDSIRLRGQQYIRFRDMSKHNRKILLTFEEFQVLSNLTPVIIRYLQQLITYSPIISDYLYISVHSDPVVPLIYGPVDHSIYNRLPQEVSFYRRTGFLMDKWRSDKAKQKVFTKKDQQVNPEKETVQDGGIDEPKDTKMTP